MKAIVWHGAHEIKLEERPAPEPGKGQVLVKMKAFGICGSDIKLYKYGVLGTLKPSKPFVMGHEGSGEVVKAGEGINGVKIGQRICINPQAACGECFYCKRNEQNLCEHLDFKSVTGDGVFAEYVVIRADQAIPLADGVDFVAGTSIEPLSVAVQAVRLGQPQPDDKVLIYGAGTIGLLLLEVLRIHGVTNTLVVDVERFALERAAKLGALGTVNPQENDLALAIKATLGERAPDIVFEMAGSSATQSQTLDLLRPGGTAVMVGISPDAMTSINMNRVVRSALRVLGSVRTSADTFMVAARLVNRGEIDPHPVISKVYPFEQCKEAFEEVDDKSKELTKVVLKLE